MSEIVTRQQAISKGLIKYYTGRPCKHGHYSFRYVNTASCCACLREAARVTRGRIEKSRISQNRGIIDVSLRVPLHMKDMLYAIEMNLTSIEDSQMLADHVYSLIAAKEFDKL